MRSRNFSSCSCVISPRDRDASKSSRTPFRRRARSGSTSLPRGVAIKDWGSLDDQARRLCEITTDRSETTRCVAASAATGFLAPANEPRGLPLNLDEVFMIQVWDADL